MSRLQIAVIGAATADARLAELARRVGTAIAASSATLLTGGGGGVMRAAWQGAKAAGGTTAAIRPDTPRSATVDDYDVRLFTGMGQARNVVLVLSADAVVAVGGGWGTLSEIALARKHGIPVVLLESWRVQRYPTETDDELDRAADPEAAVRRAIERTTE